MCLGIYISWSQILKLSDRSLSGITSYYLANIFVILMSFQQALLLQVDCYSDYFNLAVLSLYSKALNRYGHNRGRETFLEFLALGPQLSRLYSSEISFYS